MTAALRKPVVQDLPAIVHWRDAPISTEADTPEARAERERAEADYYAGVPTIPGEEVTAKVQARLRAYLEAGGVDDEGPDE